ncbi:TetR/AcrR family transcriptional regulator [Rhodococcus sp. WS4]|nr:TetR/AcrR family transcriptional regulator [Rhodococcus sp. WS4]
MTENASRTRQSGPVRATGRNSEGRAVTPKSERTRRRILDSAAQVFAARGYADVSLRDIADAAGTKAGSMYYHFASKDELVEAVLQRAIVEIEQHVREAVDGTEGHAERLRAAIKAHTESVLERTDYARALMRMTSQIPEPIRERHNRYSRDYGEYWGSLFEAARDAGEVRVDLDLTVARLLVIGAMNWTIEWPGSLWSPEAIAATLSKILFEGINPPARP